MTPKQKRNAKRTLAALKSAHPSWRTPAQIASDARLPASEVRPALSALCAKGHAFHENGKYLAMKRSKNARLGAGSCENCPIGCQCPKCKRKLGATFARPSGELHTTGMFKYGGHGLGALRLNFTEDWYALLVFGDLVGNISDETLNYFAQKYLDESLRRAQAFFSDRSKEARANAPDETNAAKSVSYIARSVLRPQAAADLCGKMGDSGYLKWLVGKYGARLEKPAKELFKDIISETQKSPQYQAVWQSWVDEYKAEMAQVKTPQDIKNLTGVAGVAVNAYSKHRQKGGKMSIAEYGVKASERDLAVFMIRDLIPLMLYGPSDPQKVQGKFDPLAVSIAGAKQGGFTSGGANDKKGAEFIQDLVYMQEGVVDTPAALKPAFSALDGMPDAKSLKAPVGGLRVYALGDDTGLINRVKKKQITLNEAKVMLLADALLRGRPNKALPNISEAKARVALKFASDNYEAARRKLRQKDASTIGPLLEDVPKTAQDGTDDYGHDKTKIPDFNTVSKPSDREYIKDLCDAILEPIEHLMSTNKALWASLTENM